MAAFPSFQQEPEFSHGRAPAIAVLYCNLGTPDEPTPAAVRRYLAEFLTDPRVVELPGALWRPLLHGLILPFRAGKSAAKYAKIWSADGSPLLLWTDKQAKLLQGWLGEHGHRVKVRFAMRYGNPSIASQLDALKAEGATRILILPAYPQYAGSTTASAIDAVAAWSARIRNLPELRFVNRYHDDRGYLQALARRIQEHWRQHGRGDHLVMSFHGVPERSLHLGDPYHCECQKTARLLAAHLLLDPAAYTLSFQSRFGKAKWLEPHTDATLRALARRGVARVDVVCPGFTADCLETLEEIAIEGRRTFLASGGKELHYIPCLNDDPAWIAALGALAQRHLAGWPTQEAPDADTLRESRAAAMASGAAR
ncbi:MAG: ferrochelatase [Ramlibacter sp.]|nr:ferrochelatase [Ramlibacter sp.]